MHLKPPIASAHQSTVTAKDASWGRWFLIAVALVGLLVNLSLPTTGELFSSHDLLIVYLTCATVILICHLVVHRQQNWLRLDTIFLLGFYVVYFQWIAMATLSDVIPERLLGNPASRTHIVDGARLASLGLHCWIIGYAFAQPKPKAITISQIKGLSKVVAAFVLLSALFAVTAGADYWRGAIYREISFGQIGTTSGIASYAFELLSLVAVITVAVLFFPGTSNASRSATRRLAYLLIAVYCVAFTIAGERGAVIQVISVAGVVYCSLYRPLPFWQFLALVVAGAFAFSVLGVVRTGRTDDLFSFVEAAGWHGVTLNLANSAVALHLAIQAAESHGPFLGQLWISNLLSPIPFAQSAFLGSSTLEYWEINSAYYLQYLRYGPAAQTSDGTTMIGDIFINYGSGGVVVCMLAYGVICKHVSRYLSAQHGLFPFVAAAIFVSLTFYASRASYFVQLRPIVWGLALAAILLEAKRGHRFIARSR